MGCIDSKPKGQSANTVDKRNVLKSNEKQGAKELKQNYHIDNDTKVLGNGSFGKVFLTHNKHNTKHQVAIKVLNKKKLVDHLDAIQEEIQILTRLDHPNIVKYYETYIDDRYIYLVMEYIDGGELFDFISKQKNQVFSEKLACDFMKKLFGAVSHMHAQGIVHRDIKAENIMLNSQQELKLIDFGLSKRQQGKKKLHTVAGTPYYMAPEVLDGTYDSKCDTWSLGCLLYVFMSGYLPFQGKNQRQVFDKIQSGKFHFNHPEFKVCSPEVMDLISQLLIVEPSKRLSASDALKHNWFVKMTEVQDEKANVIDVNVIKRLAEFKGVSKLKKAAMNMLVKMADQKQIEALRGEFTKIDKDGTGLINAEELRIALKNSQMDLPDQKVDQIIDECDYFGNKKINYTEFLVATLDVKNFLDDNQMRAIFNQFDTNNSGSITRENLITAMAKIGHDITNDELDEIMREHDLENNGVISYLEFKAIFLDVDDIRDERYLAMKAENPSGMPTKAAEMTCNDDH